MPIRAVYGIGIHACEVSVNLAFQLIVISGVVVFGFWFWSWSKGIIIIIIIIRSRIQQRSVASTQSGHDDEPWTIRYAALKSRIE